MSQFPIPTEPRTSASAPQRTSGLAIASIVCDVLCCTAILGVLLGIAAFVSIGKDPAKKGKGLALAGIIIGVVIVIGQALLVPVGMKAWSFVREAMAFVMTGPQEALADGFSGDVAGFRAGFSGAGATLTDAEAKAFLDELQTRYGSFTSAALDESRAQGQQPRPGQTQMTMPYLLDFGGTSVQANVELIFVDPANPQALLMKLGSITVVDAERGDLTYPPAAAPAAPAPAGP
jgi:hypothetical protein